MTTLKKTLSFGKYAFSGKRVENLFELEVTLKDAETDKPKFSVVGIVWNRFHTDWKSGGQCLDEMAEYCKEPLFTEICDLWHKYHLNDMHGGTREQEEELKKFHEWQKKNGKQIDYLQDCEHLKALELYEVDATEYGVAEPYKYGYKWLYWGIPQKDLKRIKEILTK